MRLKPEQLDAALKKQLAPVYLVTGDEPLQAGEAADAIRVAAKQAGFLQREVLTVENDRFNWAALPEIAASLSIFADKKLIDLRLPSAKPGKEGGKALAAYCQALSDDTVLLITAGKIAASTQKTRWFQALDKAGVIIQVWPLQGTPLLQWLKQRSLKRGLKIQDDALQWLASRVEGNMLAAAQEIEKLYVLHGGRTVTRQQLQQEIADYARFDVFKLAESLLAGQLNTSERILSGLKPDGVAEPVVLWAVSREARALLQLRQAGRDKTVIFRQYQIWESRQALYNQALQRLNKKQLEKLLQQCALIDRQIKGQALGDCWESLFETAVLFCRPDFTVKIA
jgi:DNA polymerase-3 subunit delta